MKLLYTLSISLLVLISVQAQTTGPGQPEVQGFMPVNATKMVDLYSGDLSYNIPLMTIPGPEGMSYPLNIFYNSNVSMEMMPSMVGLGWNLNTGAIVRNLRGLPDDFNGDKVEQTSYTKPSWTISFDLTKNKLLKKEIAGLDFSLDGSYRMYYNNYSGVGLSLGPKLALSSEFTDDSKNSSNTSTITGALGLDFDNQEGITLSPSLSFEFQNKEVGDKYDKGMKTTTEIGAKINSKQGFKDINYGFHRKKWEELTFKGFNEAMESGRNPIFFKNKTYNGFKCTYASSSPYTPIKQERFTATAYFGFAFGPKPSFFQDDERAKVTGSFMRSWVSGVTKESEAYGAMYMPNWQSRKEEESILTDFYRENDGLMHKKRMITPIPILTHDLFTVQGHGIGGTFRIHQGSIGRLNEATMKSRVTSGTLNFEVGAGPAFKLGSDIAGSYGESYSGHWKNPDKYMKALDFEFKSRSNLYEPFYFKMIGEPSFMEQSEWELYEKETPIAFDIQAIWTKTKAFSRYNRSGKFFHKRANENRIKRITNIEFFKRRELENLTDTKPKHIVDEDNDTYSHINYGKGESHHIQGYSLLKSNGTRYNYFLPAYNHETTRETFTIHEDLVTTVKETTKILPASFSQYAKINNQVGDEYYSKEVIPAYVHTYFITSILSHDYVDINNNGPDGSDLGTYIKFNYIESPDYKWRFPFEGYYYSRGNISNKEDDKASAQWGTKDLYYIKSIETKTHIAVFEYDINKMKMKDANGVAKNEVLKSIKLYSKSADDYADGFYYNNSANPTPIQTITFTQDYSLKPNTPNSLASTEGNGVLTLNELQFTYQDNTKGELTPYKFSYGQNEKYDAIAQDVWGAYQPDQIQTDLYNNENPFTYQYDDYADRTKDASAWLLNKIILPSKGEIHIDYEKDDYAYVQSKKAMSYLKIEGTGRTNLGISGDPEIKDDDKYIYFKSPIKLNNQSDIDRLVEGIEYVKFRIYVDLKKDDLSLKYASDYVEGYAKVKSYGILNIGANTGYIEVDLEEVKLSKYNPLRLACFQYLRKARPDLGPDYNDPSNLSPAVFAARYLPDMLTELSSLIGYYGTAKVKNYAPSLDSSKPSFIRLNMPYRKYGGGTRVKKINLISNDINEARVEAITGKKIPIYGQEYKYLQPDGKTSSGVAEFEPLVNLSENPFTQPIFYGMKKKILFSEGGYLPEEPLGAGLYPSAKVGYSRVSVRNKAYKTATDTVSLAQSGVNVSEFYTAKDFPTKADRSGALFAPMNIPTVPIPFIGNITFQHNGYSQGYSFHKFEGIYGQPKSVATYSYTEEEPVTPPIQESVYSYKTKVGDSKSLSDWVTVLHKEGQKEKLYLNKNVDFYIDEIEASSFHTSLGGQVNLLFQPPVQFFPSLFPAYSYLNKSTRYLTTNKVAYTYPVLEKVEQFKDGAKVTTRNLAYDGETGESIITSVTNEWEKPVYTYNFPAHWSYEQMKGAYKNYRAEVSIQQNSSGSGGQFKLGSIAAGSPIPKDYLKEGDILKMIPNPLSSSSYTPEPFYVSNLDRVANTFDLRQRNNTSATPGDYTVIVSGYKNLQSLKKGHIVSLEDYSSTLPNTGINLTELIATRYNIAQAAFANDTLNISSQNDTIQNPLGNIDLMPCGPEENIVSYSFNIVGSQLIFYFGSSCSAYIDLSSFLNVPSIDVSKFKFILPVDLNNVQMVYKDNGHPLNNTVFPINIQSIVKCIECPKPKSIPVLQASAIEYKDDFELNYKRLEDESTDLTASLTQIRDNGSGNPWAFGIQGIWRPWRTSSYLEKRKQTEPGKFGKELRLDLDGEFDFYWFNWDMPINYNEDYNWRWVNEVTQYNPNGLSQEGRNRLDIHSASLFGYNNHLVTASASNSKTTDIAFDGFEDYDPSSSSFTGLGHGNLNLTKYEFYEEGHTGNRSLNIGSCNGLSPVPTPNYCSSTYLLNPDFFQPKLNTRYYISGWTKYLGELGTPKSEIVVRINGISQSFRVDRAFGPIDGWYKIDGYFDILTSLNNFSITLGTGSSDGYAVLFDDIRIQPFHSGMETYVYDPENYRLRATLNNQNFATFYTYDEEGSLVSTKVETEEGIKTISTNRNNIHQD